MTVTDGDPTELGYKYEGSSVWTWHGNPTVDYPIVINRGAATVMLSRMEGRDLRDWLNQFLKETKKDV